jgi:1,4-alpha-glucan branching enzyme
MGWMHDFLDYMKTDPLFRKGNHNKMTFSLMYAYSERFILVLSHDEVVHLKCSMLNKMPGLGEDKFRNLKLAYMYMTAHPGKKLLFMGQEFAQPTEWSEKRGLDWHVLNDKSYRDIQEYTKLCLKLYRDYPALYATDYDPEGFQWSNADDSENSIFSFMRYSPDGKKSLLFVLNFTPIERKDYVIGVPDGGTYKLILDEHGKAEESVKAHKADFMGHPYTLKMDLSGYAIRVYEFHHKKA